jgi:hypothetical protein
MLPWDLNVIFRFAKKEKNVPDINPNAFEKDVFNKYFSIIQYTIKSIKTVKIPIITKYIISLFITNLIYYDTYSSLTYCLIISII